jgi:hypothetical protein
MIRSRWFSLLACAGAAGLLIAVAALAQEPDEQAELAKKLQNPVAALISPIQFSLGPKLYVEGPTTAPDWGIRFAVTLLFPQ